MRGAIRLLSIILALVSWSLWRLYPDLFFCCCSFWVAMATFNIMVRSYQWLPGLLCNATATITNGGYMPVFGMEASGGVHIQGTPDAAMQILCDQFWGASIGDFLLLAALVFSAIVWARSATNTPSIAAR